MNFEDLQKTWQAQPAPGRVTINTEVLLREVRRNQRQFQTTIFWRDVREVGVAWLLVPVFAWLGVHRHDWMQYLIALACFGIGAFFIVDRQLQRNKQPIANDPLKFCVTTSLHQVTHQIWLLKNVAWWYLLPLAIPLVASNIADLLRSHDTGMVLALNWVVCVIVNLVIFGGVYWVNQYAVRKSLEPRRQELENLLASLE